MFSLLDWNLVVTAFGGRRHDLIYALRPIVRLKRAGYSEVLIGRCNDVDACLEAIAARADPAFVAEILARVIPVGGTFRLVSDDGPSFATALEAQLVAETAALVPMLAGRSFHVRVERRGHRSVVQSDHLERGIGTALVEALRAHGDAPCVTFKDPDVIVAVELIGAVGGIGLVPRALRARYPFVRL